MTLDLTPQQFNVLLGLIDTAIKQLGVRAMEDDVIDMMSAIKAAVKPAQEE